MDALTALRLQLEWGADEALADAPLDRTAMDGTAMDGALPVESAPSQEPPLRQLSRPAPVVAILPEPSLVARARAAAEAAPTLEALVAALAAFDGCALAHTASRLVFTDGNPTAALMLVGDCPGDEEDRTGKPFVGPAGRLLDRMFASIGLDRSHFLATNLIPWRPPGGRPPTEAEIAICLPFLQRHVALVAPRRLVLLGSLATRAMLGGTPPLSRARGRWHEVAVPGLDRPVLALPMAHPLGLLKAPRGKRDAWMDLLRLRQALDSHANVIETRVV